MSSPFTTHIIEGTAVAAEGLMVCVVFMRARWRTMPVFASLCTFSLVEDVVLMCVERYGSRNVYFWTYWIFATLDYVFQLALIGEIARSVLKPAAHWIKDARSTFAWCSALASIMGGMLVLWIVPHSLDTRERVYRSASLLTSLLTCLCLLALTETANRLRLPRKDHTRAVGQGLALWNICCIASDVALTTGASPRTIDLAENVQHLVWGLTLFYWARSLWPPEAVLSNNPMDKDFLASILSDKRSSRHWTL